MKSLLIATILSASVAGAHAQVYKCVVDGRTVYSQTPCQSDAQELQIDKRGFNPNAATGVRESERAFIDRRKAEESERQQLPQPPSPDTNSRPFPKQCGALILISATPFDIERVRGAAASGRIVAGVVERERCVQIQWSAPTWAGLLTDDETATQVAQKTRVILSNGEPRLGQRAILNGGKSDRITGNGVYGGVICYGDAAFEIIEIGC